MISIEYLKALKLHIHEVSQSLRDHEIVAAYIQNENVIDLINSAIKVEEDCGE